MKELLHKMKSLPTATSVQEKNAQELQLLIDALVQKSNELGLTMNLTFNNK
jgi:hypothetical protein